MNTVIQILGAVTGDARGHSDGQLLERFVRLRDEGAFATVVRRHGPMVLGVCRRVLGNAADADDAFQATFLVLARKAASVTARDRLAGWLQRVALNAARKLRRANLRRAAHEHARAAPSEPATEPPEPRFELIAVLDEELARLPDRYRAVLVLCDLEGHTRAEAARALGCPEG
ncbi:MAG TPA: sigma-70 family RNA polymerase sigma factor, partial [Gemmata sp.]